MFFTAPEFVSIGIAFLSIVGWVFAFGTDVSTRLPHERPRYRRLSVWIDCVALGAFITGLAAAIIGMYVKPTSSYLLHGLLAMSLAGAWGSYAHRPQVLGRIIYRTGDGVKCQRCGYPIGGVLGDQCPECGESYSPYRKSGPSLEFWRVCFGLVGWSLVVAAVVLLYLCIIWELPQPSAVQKTPSGGLELGAAGGPVFVLVGVVATSAVGWMISFGTDVRNLLPGEVPRYRQVKAWIDCVAWGGLITGVAAWLIALFSDWGQAYSTSGSVAVMLAAAWVVFAHGPAVRALVVYEERCGRCGYSTVGLRGDICPECGSTLPADRYRRRLRRSLSTTVIVAVAVVAATGVLVLVALMLF